MIKFYQLSVTGEPVLEAVLRRGKEVIFIEVLDKAAVTMCSINLEYARRSEMGL